MVEYRYSRTAVDCYISLSVILQNTVEYLDLGNFVVFDLDKFERNVLELNLLQLLITLNLTFPILEVKAKPSNFSIILGNLIPLKGEGPSK
jgi:hypothetical protein